VGSADTTSKQCGRNPRKQCGHATDPSQYDFSYLVTSRAGLDEVGAAVRIVQPDLLATAVGKRDVRVSTGATPISDSSPRALLAQLADGATSPVCAVSSYTYCMKRCCTVLALIRRCVHVLQLAQQGRLVS
jgi:predicted HAD superfamily phosphohydrolase